MLHFNASRPALPLLRGPLRGRFAGVFRTCRRAEGYRRATAPPLSGASAAGAGLRASPQRWVSLGRWESGVFVRPLHRRRLGVWEKNAHTPLPHRKTQKTVIPNLIWNLHVLGRHMILGDSASGCGMTNRRFWGNFLNVRRSTQERSLNGGSDGSYAQPTSPPSSTRNVIFVSTR